MKYLSLFSGIEAVNQMADIVDRQTCHDVADFDRESFKCSRGESARNQQSFQF